MTRISIGFVLLKFLSTTRVLNMGSFLIIVVKLSSYKDGDVGNLRKSECLIRILRTFSGAGKYNLTIYLRFFRPVTKVKNTNNCKAVLDFKHMGLFLICQGMRGWKDHAI